MPERPDPKSLSARDRAALYGPPGAAKGPPPKVREPVKAPAKILKLPEKPPAKPPPKPFAQGGEVKPDPRKNLTLIQNLLNADMPAKEKIVQDTLRMLSAPVSRETVPNPPAPAPMYNGTADDDAAEDELTDRLLETIDRQVRTMARQTSAIEALVEVLSAPQTVVRDENNRIKEVRRAPRSRSGDN